MCGWRGTIPGKQTVPRAEALALMQFMRFYAGVCFDGSIITICIDNKGVVDRFHKGPRVDHDYSGVINYKSGSKCND